MDVAGLVPLPDGARAPAAARALVRERLGLWGLGHLLDPMLLLVSELVTNGVVHTSGPVSIGLDREGTGVLVRVVDTSQVLPVRRRRSMSATTGRGVALLEDLADDWGVHRLEAGKLVWFCLAASATSAWESLGAAVPPLEPGSGL